MEVLEADSGLRTAGLQGKVILVVHSMPLVGRRSEVAQLTRAMDRATSGEGGVVILGGEAGIGKTSLLHSAVRMVQGALVATGRCPGHGETPPFGPWLEALAELPSTSSAELPPPIGGGGERLTPLELAGALPVWLGQFDAPIMICLEDIHWADPASLDLLRHLAPRLSRTRVLVLATYRSDEIDREHPMWALLRTRT